MAIDLRSTYQAVALRAQQENAARLVAGEAAAGGPVAPRKDGTKPGVRSGAMLTALLSPSSVRVGERGFEVVVVGEVAERLEFFIQGTTRQPPRPVLGFSRALVNDARSTVARVMRDQVVQQLRRREV